MFLNVVGFYAIFICFATDDFVNENLLGIAPRAADVSVTVAGLQC